MKTRNIAIADDHPLLRKGLSNFLSKCGFNVVIEAANGKELISALRKNTILPDSCIVDMNMPQMNGMDTLASVKRHWPAIKVFLYSMQDDSELMNHCRRQGADGYILKGTNDDELLAMLRE
ncbi:response regulator transcription factor [Pedobacter sp. UBA4863]|uniref:response regulator n=1 Tax=Pedobacter sp. UBA4863 TaxID=1947060 RepID=UPI0025E1F5A6|nr:response regulator transcription factor [Pedobacter sp. UBA4863]